MSTSVYMVNPIIAIYVKQFLNASLSEVGIVVSATFAASFLVKLPLGLILAGKRLYHITIISVLIMTMMPIAYAYATSVSSIIVLRVIHGFGLGLIWSLLWTEVSNVESGEGMISSVARFANHRANSAANGVVPASRSVFDRR